MATILERVTKSGQKRYTVQIRIKGQKPMSRTFDRKTEAKAFAQDTESDLRRGRYLSSEQSRKRTLGECIDRYIETVLPTKATSTQKDQKRQLLYWKDRIGYMVMSNVSPGVLADERSLLLKGKTTRKKSGKLARSKKRQGNQGSTEECATRSKATVNRYLAALSHCLTYAQKELGWIRNNPMKNVTKLKEPRGRVRILSENERNELLKSCKESHNPHLFDIVILALSTAARRAEITHLKWRHVDFARRVIVLDETKNGEIRVIPIRGEAERILAKRSKIRDSLSPFVFSAQAQPGKPPKPIDIQSAWDWALERAGIKDFRFHDLRHTAASYLAMNGATNAEIAEVMGHKTLQMVKRYSHFTEGHTGDLIERMNNVELGDIRKGV